MNTGMQDAFNLAWKLALVERGQAQAEALLATYSLERSKVAEQVLRRRDPSHRGGHAAQPDRAVPAQSNGQHLILVRLRARQAPRHARRAFDPLPLQPAGNRRVVPRRRQEAACRSPCRRSFARRPLGHAAGDVTTLFQATRSAGHTLMLVAGDGSPEAVGHLQALASRVEAAFPGVLSPLLIVPSSGTVPKGRNRCPRTSIAKGSFAGNTVPAPRRSSSCGPTDTSAIAANRPTPIGCSAISIRISCAAECSAATRRRAPPCGGLLDPRRATTKRNRRPCRRRWWPTSSTCPGFLAAG